MANEKLFDYSILGIQSALKHALKACQFKLIFN